MATFDPCDFGPNNRLHSLAYCELYVGLTAVVLRVFPKMELFETTEEAVKYDHDVLFPMPKDGARDVRVKVV